MQYISTTELRTKSSDLVKLLAAGVSINLLHRSRLIGVIDPAKSVEKRGTDIEKLEATLKALKPSRVIPIEKRKDTIRSHLLKKYGKNIS